MNGDIEAIDLGKEFARLDREAGVEVQGTDGAISGEVITKEQQEALEKREAGEVASLLRDILQPMFDELAPGWGVSPAEVDNLAVAYTLVAQKRAPGGLSGISQNAPELIALSATVPIAVKALRNPRKITEQTRVKPVDEEKKPEPKPKAKPRAKKPSSGDKSPGSDVPPEIAQDVQRRK